MSTTDFKRRQISGRGIPVTGNDIDTDRIIPARFLKAVTFEGNRSTEAMVMDLDAQTITHIDYKDRFYMTATAKEYGEVLKQGMQMAGEMMGKEMQAQMKEMEAELKKLPPEQRRAMEAMMKQMQQGAKQTPAAPTIKPEDCKPPSHTGRQKRALIGRAQSACPFCNCSTTSQVRTGAKPSLSARCSSWRTRSPGHGHS